MNKGNINQIFVTFSTLVFKNKTITAANTQAELTTIIGNGWAISANYGTKIFANLQNMLQVPIDVDA